MSAEELQRSTTSDFFQERSRAGSGFKELRILLLHPDSPAFHRRIEEVNAPANVQLLVDRKKDIVRALSRNLQSLTPYSIARFEIRFYADFPIWVVQMYDSTALGGIDEMEVTIHLPGRHGRYSPRYLVSKEAPLFQAFAREFDKRWASAIPMRGFEIPPLDSTLTVRAVVFDLDGTLIDSDGEKRETVWQILSELGGPDRSDFDREYSRHEGSPRSAVLAELRDEFITGKARSISADQLLQRYEEIYAGRRQRVAERDGATHLIDTISHVVSIHLASSSPAEEAEQILKERGWARYFKSCHGFPESKADALLAIAERRCISTREILYVGDRPNDEYAAASVGANAITLGAPSLSTSTRCNDLRAVESEVLARSRVG